MEGVGHNNIPGNPKDFVQHVNVHKDKKLGFRSYSQNFHLWCIHPPNISVENQVVHPFPIRCMFCN